VVGVFTLHLQGGGEDDGGTTSSGGVHWAFIEALSLLLVSTHSSHVHNWHNWMQVLELHLSEVALLAAAARFPTGSLKEETADEGARLSELGVVGLLLAVGDLGNEAHVVEWETSSTGSHLHDGSQVGHGVEQG